MMAVHRAHQPGVEEFKRLTENKLRGLRCPEHRVPPRLQFHGSALKDMTISLSGCCSRLMDLANRAMRGEPTPPGGTASAGEPPAWRNSTSPLT